MFEMVFIICIDLEAGRRCDQNVYPGPDDRKTCETEAQAAADRTLAWLETHGLTGSVGWKCDPQGVGA